MYNTLATVYDYIFPQNIKQLELIEKVKPISEKESIIEIGCATGNLTDLLNSKSNQVLGLDLDEGLLKEARNKYPNYEFILKNMLEVNTLNKTFNRIICFGNTLVHLPNRKMVNDFFNTVYEVLEDDGIFITQIIHYNRIIEKKLDQLSTIDNEHIKFERNYKRHKNYVDFNTILTIKENNQIIENSISLLNLTKEELQKMLEQVGFKELKFYGNLNGDPLNSNSVPLLFSCKK